MIFFEANTIEESKRMYKIFSKTGIFDFFKKNKNIINENGLNRIYYNEGKGDLFQEFHMSNGRKNGLYVDYYPSIGKNRPRRQVVDFKEDLENGLYTQYNGLPEDGEEWKMYEINYENGLMHGSYKKYASDIVCYMHNNGKEYLNAEYNYRNGKKHGWCILYLLSRPGEIANKTEYKDGEEIEILDMGLSKKDTDDLQSKVDNFKKYIE